MADPQFKAPIHIALSANTLVTHNNGATLHNRGMCSVYLIKGQIGGGGGGHFGEPSSTISPRNLGSVVSCPLEEVSFN